MHHASHMHHEKIMQKYWNYCHLLLKWVPRGWQPWDTDLTCYNMSAQGQWPDVLWCGCMETDLMCVMIWVHRHRPDRRVMIWVYGNHDPTCDDTGARRHWSDVLYGCTETLTWLLLYGCRDNDLDLCVVCMHRDNDLMCYDMGAWRQWPGFCYDMGAKTMTCVLCACTETMTWCVIWVHGDNDLSFVMIWVQRQWLDLSVVYVHRDNDLMCYMGAWRQWPVFCYDMGQRQWLDLCVVCVHRDNDLVCYMGAWRQWPVFCYDMGAETMTWLECCVRAQRQWPDVLYGCMETMTCLLLWYGCRDLDLSVVCVHRDSELMLWYGCTETITWYVIWVHGDTDLTFVMIWV